jgi:hypothetical protein
MVERPGGKHRWNALGHSGKVGRVVDGDGDVDGDVDGDGDG